MNVLITGSSGHLGEALVRTLTATTHQVVGLDRSPSSFTEHVGTITDRDFVRMQISAILRLRRTVVSSSTENGEGSHGN